MRRTDRGIPYLSWCLSIRNSDPVLLEGTLKSIRERTPEAEIVVVDNCSRESATIDTAKKYADVFYTYRGPRETWTPDDTHTTDMSASRQKAFQIASGKWRAWIDDDDRLPGPEEAKKLLQTNSQWRQAPASAQIVDDNKEPIGLEDLLKTLDEKHPDVDCVWAPYLYAKDNENGALTWQERERIIKWSEPPKYAWAEAAHEILVPKSGYTPKYKVNFAHLLFVHERKWSLESMQRTTKRHWNVLLQQYDAGDKTTRRCLYLAAYSLSLSPEREREFIDAAHLSATTILDRYRCMAAYGQMFARQGLYLDAWEYYSAAVGLRPDLPDAWLKGAEVWEKQQQYHRAMEWYEKGIAAVRGDINSDIVPRHQEVRFPAQLSQMCLKIADLQIKAGLDEEAKGVLLKGVAAIAKVKDSPAVTNDERDKREADVLFAKTRNAFMAQCHAINIKHLAQYLIDNDEPKKAMELLDTVPWNLEDHPAVVDLKKRLRPVAKHLVDPAAYLDFYMKDAETGYMKSPESWMDPANSITRVRWLANWLNTNSPNATVLDYGCCDGIVGIPLLRLCPSITYVGADIHKLALATFQERLVKYGVQGRANLFRVDKPEDLAAQCNKKFDVAIWFEVIEHVPDPALELSKIISYLKKGGQMFVTTPWGSFDSGHPPKETTHGTKRDSRGHVRVLTARNTVDIFDSIGLETQDLFRDPAPIDSTGDGLHIQASNRPSAAEAGRKLANVSFVVPTALWDWSGRTLMAEGMGASEKSIVQYSTALAQEYRKTEVFGPIPEETVYSGVRYWPREHLHHVKSGKIVISRHPLFYKHIDDTLETKLPKILWLQDAFYKELNNDVADHYDKIVVVSDWHKQAMHEMHGVALDKMVTVYNPIDARFYTQKDKPKRKVDHFIYASSPDRGLIKLLELWPRILEKLPEATLDVFYGFRGAEKLGGGNDAHWNKRYEACRRAFEKLRYQKGITVYNMVNPGQLANAYLSAGVWAYPTDFTETCCTNALEARSAGCVPVCPPLAALNETARCTQALLTIGRDNPAFDDEFVDACFIATKVSVKDREAMADEAIANYRIEKLVPLWKDLLA